MDLYAQNIMDHYRHPRNVGKLEGVLAHHREANYSCGDIIEAWVEIKNEVVTDIKYQGEGCAVSQAAISILSEHIKNKKSIAILELDFPAIVKLLGVDVSQRRKKCAVLGLLAVQNALLTAQKKPLKKWSDILTEE